MGSRSNKDERTAVRNIVRSKPGPTGEDRFEDARTGEPTRNKVGQADDATRKRELAKRLAEREPIRKVATEPVRMTGNPDVDTPTKDLSVFSVPRKIRGARQRRDDQIERNSRGEP